MDEFIARTPRPPRRPADALLERNPHAPATTQGVFRKFCVHRVDGRDAPGGKHDGCEYFVLDTRCDPYARVALAAYAAACSGTHPALAADMRDRYGLATDAEGSDDEAP